MVQTATGILVMLMDRDQSAVPGKLRYKRGDIVAVYPPGKTFHNPPAEPWYFVEITGTLPLTFDEVKRRYQQMEQTVILDVGTGQHRIDRTRRRLFHVNLDALPAAVLDELTANRYLSVPWTAVRSYVRNRTTGEVEG